MTLCLFPAHLSMVRQISSHDTLQQHEAVCFLCLQSESKPHESGPKCDCNVAAFNLVYILNYSLLSVQNKQPSP